MTQVGRIGGGWREAITQVLWADAERRVSARPSDMVAGGSLIDDVDVNVVGGKVVTYDFGGKGTGGPQVCLALDCQTDDGQVHTEYLKIADPKFFQPTRDEKGIVAIGDKGNLLQKSKYDLFAKSLIDLGFDESKIGDEFTWMVGGRYHVKRTVPKEWAGLPKSEGQREATAFVVTQVHKWPGEAAARGRSAAASTTKAAPATKANGKAPASAGNGSDVDSELAAYVEAFLGEAGGNAVAKKDLVSHIFKNATGDNKKAMIKRVAENDFLEAGMGDGKWMFDEAAGTIQAL